MSIWAVILDWIAPTSRKLDTILALLRRVDERTQNMATLQQFQEAHAAVILRLQNIAGDIQALKDIIAGSGMSPADEDAALALVNQILEQTTVVDESAP